MQVKTLTLIEKVKQQCKLWHKKTVITVTL